MRRKNESKGKMKNQDRRVRDSRKEARTQGEKKVKAERKLLKVSSKSP
jgi:hypothetical protein